MQEEILYQQSRTGTTALYFSTAIREGDIQGAVPSVCLLNNQGQPQYINQFDGNEVWIRNSNNNWVRPTEFDNYFTGYSYAEVYNYVFDNQDRQTTRLQFQADMQTLYGENTSYVLFHDAEIDDMFVTTKLIRSRATLDTLDVYNNLTNSLPDQESDTGTLIGTLQARQEIRDAAGNRIKIPLANVPVGVFLASEDFPTLNATDNNGDRITLNLRESATEEEYFDIQSFTQDTTEYLKSGSQFDIVPNHYKLCTYTNENGEFILTNVPTGSQVLMFEVDLFKQGLTKDEIALNNFPFPVNDEAELGSIPSLYFQQVPIEIVPTWGSFQTGYTETNITVNLDLRKWATYYTNPITFEGRPIEELQAKGFNSPLTFDIRDMSLEGYPIRNKEVVEIQTMFDRDPDSRLRWYSEFAQRKRSAQFRTKGYHAFKVPANMYDPDGFKTDRFGNPTSSRGVWLAGYQISMHYISKDTVFRHTGLEKTFTDGGNFTTRDHFNLNRNNQSLEESNAGAQGVIGEFPYEQPWSPIYPTQYTIPRVPTQLNPNYEFTDDQGRRFIERPRFLDGDMVGRQFSDFVDDNQDSDLGGVGGYGVTYAPFPVEQWFKNNFSKTVTQNFIYKYEQGVNQNEMYANGYKPNDPLFGVDAGASSVLNGEQYQRVECGHAYYLRPEGMPRVHSYPWWNGSEAMFDIDTRNPNSTVSISQSSDDNSRVSVAPYTNSITAENFDDGLRIQLEMGNTPAITEGALDIYRIVDPSPYNLVEPDPTPTPQFVKLFFQNFYAQRGKSGNRLKPAMQNSGSGNGDEFWGGTSEGATATKSTTKLRITNKGAIEVTIEGIITLAPNQSYDIPNGLFGDFNGMQMTLPCNSLFDFEEFKYTRAKYDMEWIDITLYKANLNQEGTQFFSRAINGLNLVGGNEGSGTPKYYLRTRLVNLRTNYNDGSGLFSSEGCKDSWVRGSKGEHSVAINGMALVSPSQNKGDWYDSYFASSQVGNYTCSGGISGLIPYRLT